VQSVTLNDRQSGELIDEIGKLLAIQLDSEQVKNKVNRIMADYCKRNNISCDVMDISKNISWSVKVSLKK
jgi:hypothetical protein